MSFADPALVSRIAERSMRWPFRMWAFGEAIVLDGLLATADATGRADLFGFVHGICRAALGRGVGKAPEDHVAPGRAYLALHRKTGDLAFLDAARALAALNATFPKNRHGARMPRAHLAGWRAQIWVDSMDVVAPFLADLAGALGDDRLYDQAADELLSYARLLQEESGLFRHGYEADCGPNGQVWARGNGWALLGMVETLTLLPRTHPARAEIGERLMAQIAGLEATQRPDGLWHTLVEDSGSYAESTLAAMVAVGVAGAHEARLVPAGTGLAMAAKARPAVLAQVSDDGALKLVSDATPVGEAAMYRTRPFGIFPWGQGPLLLMVSKT